MTPNSSIIKLTAKTALKGNQLKSIIASLILIISGFVISTIASLISIISGEIFAVVLSILFYIFLLFPLFMGLLRYFWRLILGTIDNPISVFYYYSEKALYIKAIHLIFAFIIKCIPIGIILNLPAIFVWIISKNFIFDLINIPTPLWSTNLSYAVLLLRTLATVILVIYMLKFYIAPVLFVADENIDVAEALHMSAVISKKTTLDFIYLFFSFLGWLLLSVFIIPLIYTLPYILTAYLVHVRFVIADYNKHIKKNNNTDFPSFEAGI